jgi:hypothetical protein
MSDRGALHDALLAVLQAAKHLEDREPVLWRRLKQLVEVAEPFCLEEPDDPPELARAPRRPDGDQLSTLDRVRHDEKSLPAGWVWDATEGAMRPKDDRHIQDHDARVFEAVNGYPKGEDWRLHLMGGLHAHVYVREQNRAKKARGIPLPTVEPWTAAQILQFVRKHAEDPVPDGLSELVIEQALPLVGFGKGGRGKEGGRTPEGWVRWFAGQLRKHR